ncbi:MAG: hypothetical protein ACERKD_05985 [Prolixibacteraceae bacterium]
MRTKIKTKSIGTTKPSSNVNQVGKFENPMRVSFEENTYQNVEYPILTSSLFDPNIELNKTDFNEVSIVLNFKTNQGLLKVLRHRLPIHRLYETCKVFHQREYSSSDKGHKIALEKLIDKSFRPRVDKEHIENYLIDYLSYYVKFINSLAYYYDLRSHLVENDWARYDLIVDVNLDDIKKSSIHCEIRDCKNPNRSEDFSDKDDFSHWFSLGTQSLKYEEIIFLQALARYLWNSGNPIRRISDSKMEEIYEEEKLTYQSINEFLNRLVELEFINIDSHCFEEEDEEEDFFMIRDIDFDLFKPRYE